LASNTQIVHDNPSSVKVTVTEIPIYRVKKGGKASTTTTGCYADIHIVVNPRFAHVDGQGHTPTPTSVTASTVSWLNQLIDVNPSDFVAYLDQAVGAESTCSAVTVIVSGVGSEAEDDYYSVSPTVCFP